MRLDLTLFGSSGMERIVQKFVSEEINSRTDILRTDISIFQTTMSKFWRNVLPPWKSGFFTTGCY
jgi:hypothetical protein